MSFDLKFIPKPGKELDYKKIEEVFSEHPFFGRDPKDKNQFFYKHPNTGVMFFININKQDSCLQLRLNYARPHFYGAETFLILKPLIESLDFLVMNPQDDDKPKAFVADELYMSWWAGNKWAWQNGIKKHGAKPKILPFEKIDAWWHFHFLEPYALNMPAKEIKRLKDNAKGVKINKDEDINLLDEETYNEIIS